MAQRKGTSDGAEHINLRLVTCDMADRAAFATWLGPAQ